ncbi:MAG: VWA domain-containing protein [Spirochaetales bacterium]|nr:VWA domain-containing protein [Spirochaetales bacterium]
MLRKLRFFSVLVGAGLLALAAIPVHADQRTEPVDIYLVLDKSLSMEEEISGVREYVENYIVNELLIPGDRLTMITFYGKAHIRFTGLVNDEQSLEDVTFAVSSIEADGHYTDIGNALDTLRQTLERHGSTDRRRYLLLITDGKQEAPPDSPYYSPDGSFNHQFLEQTKTIQREGWKIHILGIGTESAAKELAEQLSGTYTETDSEGAEEGELREKTQDILARVEAEGPFLISNLDRDGNGTLRFSVQTFHSDKTIPITVNDATLLIEDKGYPLLQEPIQITASEQSAEIQLPVQSKELSEFISGEEDKIVQGELVFRFDNAGFTPSRVPVSIKAPVGLPLWVLIVIAAAAAIIVLFLVLRGRGKQKPEDDQQQKARKTP